MNYPATPGFQPTDTSREAAPDRESAAIIRLRVLRFYEDHGPMTADECASRMGLSILTVRPRCTELKLTQRLADTGARRINQSGKRAAVLTLA
jgi:predicted ArsR family transcriptional regulator